MNQPCPNQEELLLLLTGDLDATEQARLNRHLESCSHCQLERSALRATLAALPDSAELPTAAETAHFTERVLTAKRRRPFGPRIWAGLATASVAAMAVFILLDAPSQPTQPAAGELAVLEELEILEQLDLLQELDVLELLEDNG